MRLQPEPRVFGHRTRAPVRLAAWSLLERLDDHLLYLLVADGPGSARTWLVVQSRRPIRHKAQSPPADHLPGDPELRCDILVLNALGARQHDPRAECNLLGCLSPTYQSQELLTLLRRHDEGPCASHDRWTSQPATNSLHFRDGTLGCALVDPAHSLEKEGFARHLNHARRGHVRGVEHELAVRELEHDKEGGFPARLAP